ncbi:MAG: hypothetical protein SFW09_09295 [Hyphomicrobiaceae bacterium]|nr:hypothetical protein [Hyphomicrobiaceae bacterium]
MAAETLVVDDIEYGRLIVEALDSADVPVSAAFWLLYGDTGTWKLWIATPEAGHDLQAAYVEIAKVLSSSGAPLIDFDLGRIRLVRSDEPMVRSLRKVVKVDGVGKVRFSSNVIDGTYIEDAIIYRLT